MHRFLILLVLCFITVFMSVSLATQDNIMLNKDNHIAFTGTVTDESVTKWMHKLYQKIKKDDSLYVYIESNGGSIMAGIRIIEQMIHLRDTLNTTFKCIAKKAYSMAFVIFQLACDERLVLPTSTIMQHQASYGLHGSQHIVKSRQSVIDKSIRKIEEQQAERLGLDIDDYLELINNEWWVLGDEAVEKKMADRLISVGCDPELAKEEYEDHILIQFGPFVSKQRVRVSQCPLIGILEEMEEE